MREKIALKYPPQLTPANASQMTNEGAEIKKKIFTLVNALTRTAIIKICGPRWDTNKRRSLYFGASNSAKNNLDPSRGCTGIILKSMRNKLIKIVRNKKIESRFNGAIISPPTST